MSLFDWLPWVRKKAMTDMEDLRSLFASRYHSFKLFLNANQSVHDLMTDIEDSLRAVQPYGMHHVRSVCTRISTAVLQLVRHLDDLAPGRFPELMTRFNDIQQQINSIISANTPVTRGPLTLSLSEIGRDQADLVGSKVANLGEIRNRLDMNVPDGFAVTTSACRSFLHDTGLQEEIDRRIQATDTSDEDGIHQLASSVQGLVFQADVPDELASAIMSNFDRLQHELGPDLHVAVRSSALGEDSEGTSFAGQYRSILNVGRSEVLLAYKGVVASKYSRQAMAYRLARGIRDEDVLMSVGFMPMIRPLAGGVAYSRNPVDPTDDHVTVHSVWGLPKAVVDGIMDTDVFILTRDDPPKVESKEVADKPLFYACNDTEGTCAMESDPDNQFLPSMADDALSKLAAQVLRLEDYYGVPQDVEWIMDRDHTIVLLQCRPLTIADDSGPIISPTVPNTVRPLFEQGITASSGAGAGQVYKVRKEAEAIAFPRGSVLVIPQALPVRAALLDRAAAVISETGSTAGHLANVAREFQVPALFGVSGAMDSLENGQMITVDADARAVFPGHLDELLVDRPDKRLLMTGSQVHATLRSAARHILRLRLLDPNDPEFKARNCRTYHDITRFSHEMAVKEMFNFGHRHDFPEAAAKQLFTDVRKQFWILNLDDGFDGDVDGPLVPLEQITSIPMRAMWDGMNIVPWEGPPPVDARGFISVLFEATMNPELVPGAGGEFGMKNYFMISRHYCSLQSRFGFHFCSAEAMVGKRSSENYASFQFKGGAADDRRKQLRARLVSDLLEEHGFTAKVRRDLVTARLEGLDQTDMIVALKVLGYLIIHTRQLDMIMTDSAEVERRRTKILYDLSVLR